MIIRDSITVDASGLKMTHDGYLIGEARVSRAGNVQKYYGSEIGLTGDDANKVFGVYRDPAVVFAESSMMTLAGRPVTRGHPPAGVTADNWKDLSVGQVGGIIKRDGEHVVAPMAIMDASAAKEVASGARSLSAGYTVGITKDEGISPSGEPYQYRQSGELRFNHVAYLPDNNPRAGNTRIGDSWGIEPIKDFQPGSTPTNRETGGLMSDANLKTVVIGDRAVQVAATDAAVFEQYKTDSAKAIADAEAKYTAAIEAKDEEIGELKVKLQKAEDAANIDVDALVAARTALVGQVKALDASIDPTGLTDSELKKAAVVAKLGAEAVKDASDAEVNGMFRVLSAVPVQQNPVADAFRAGLKVVDGDKAVTDAQSDYVARLTRRNKQEA